MDGVPTQTAGTSELLASDWNTYVRDNFDSIKFGHVVVADASARSALGNVAEGVMVYQADNQKLYVNKNGTTADWVEVADLDNTGAVSDDAADYLDQYAVQSRNVIINGAMQVAQRNTSVASITNSSAYRTVDRWRFDTGLAESWSFTMSQSTDTPSGSGFRNSFKIVANTGDSSLAAGAYCAVQQLIEGQNIQHFVKGTSSAKKFAVSFWIKSNVTGTFIVELRDFDNSRHICKAFTVNAANTWEKKTHVFSADTTGAFDNDNASSLSLIFWFAAGSDYTSGTLATSWASRTSANVAPGLTNFAAANNNEVYVTGVQLEAGDVNTPFEFEPWETTFRKCQRYYQKSYNHGTAIGAVSNYNGAFYLGGSSNGGGHLVCSLPINVPMRAGPATVTAYRVDGTSGSWDTERSGSTTTNSPTFDFGSERGSRFYISVGASWVPAYVYGHWTADAEL